MWCILPATILAAPLSATPSRVILRSPIHAMGFQCVMASAKLRYTQHDVFITLHAMHLPSPHVLHKMVYVVWVVNGAHKENIGALKVHNMMAALQAQTMMMKFQDLVVTAESFATIAKPAGRVVLSGMGG